MSNANNAASIAALAAFNAGKKKDAVVNAAATPRSTTPQSQNKPQTHLLQPPPQPRRSDTTKTAPKKSGNTHTEVPSQVSLQPAYIPDNQRPRSRDGSDFEDRASVDSNALDYFAQTPRQVSRRHSSRLSHYLPMLLPQSPRDMISNVKNSIDSKAINNDANAKRLSLDYSPHEMLKNLKDSLHRKSQAQNIPKTMDARGQTILDGVRERIDDNMKETSHNLANLSLKQYEWLKANSDAECGDNRDLNDLQSSFETCPTDVDPRRKSSHQLTPTNGREVRIDVTDHDAEVQNGQNDINDATIKVPVTVPEPDYLSEAGLLLPVANKGARRKPPPPSDEELDTIARHTTSDTDNNDDLYFNLSDGFSGDELRKQMQLNGVSLETFSSGEVVLPQDDMVSFTDNDESSQPQAIKVKDTKFPQFPDVRKHHQHLFGMRRHRLKEGDKYHRYDSGANSDDELLESPSHQLKPAAPLPQQQLKAQVHTSTSKSNLQPVQFKTTMRKTNKRKDRKTKFDELKPWKTHDELNFPTDVERKRYEGVWVSNKGLYMNSVVTKLTGVDNDGTDGGKSTTEHDDSMKAALISTNVIQPDVKIEVSDKTDLKKRSHEEDDDNGHDDDNNEETPVSKAEEAANKLHSLKKADRNQLILGAVVKRIWNRSRLPGDILEQIWNLVDFRRDGTLNKNEFLVGMWLVDQCLYGRKLPKKIEPIVWDSLGGIGVNVNLSLNSRRWK